MEDYSSTEGNAPNETAGAGARKQIAGTAILTAAGYAAGTVFGLVKKNSVGTYAAIGSGIGFLGSLGFGKEIFEVATGHGQKDLSHEEAIKIERAQGRSLQRQR